MTPPVALMRIGGNPERAPSVMKHNAEALLSDADYWHNGEVSHAAPPAASKSKLAQRGGVALD